MLGFRGCEINYVHTYKIHMLPAKILQVVNAGRQNGIIHKSPLKYMRADQSTGLIIDTLFRCSI